MKTISRTFFSALMIGFPFCALANTAPLDEKEIPNPEMTAMSFDQCVEIISDYRAKVGEPLIILDTPTLRVVRFKNDTINEQVSCDGDDNIMSLLDIEGDN